MTRTIFVFGSNLAGRHGKGAAVRPWVQPCHAAHAAGHAQRAADYLHEFQPKAVQAAA